MTRIQVLNLQFSFILPGLSLMVWIRSGWLNFRSIFALSKLTNNTSLETFVVIFADFDQFWICNAWFYYAMSSVVSGLTTHV